MLAPFSAESSDDISVLVQEDLRPRALPGVYYTTPGWKQRPSSTGTARRGHARNKGPAPQGAMQRGFEPENEGTRGPSSGAQISGAPLPLLFPGSSSFSWAPASRGTPRLSPQPS